MVYIGAVIECYSSCVHGICEIINNTYTCDCFQGWTGSYCDQGILTSYSLNEKSDIIKLQEERNVCFSLAMLCCFYCTLQINFIGKILYKTNNQID